MTDPDLSPRGVQPFDGIPTATSEIARLMDLAAAQSREVATLRALSAALQEARMQAISDGCLLQQHMEDNAALSARLAAAERRAEEAEARLDSDRLCDALSEALDEQAHLTSQGGRWTCTGSRGPCGRS